MKAEHLPPSITPNFALTKMLIGLVLTTVAIAGVLFLAAGRLDWILGWVFIAFWGLPKLVLAFILRWHDPELIVERMTCHENTMVYDRWIIPAYYAMTFITILIAGLDGGRFEWSGTVAVAWIVFAYILNLLGNALASWAVSANPFFSAESRLQHDRNQHVTRRGPYSFIRHPAYLAAILLWPFAGLMLASWWALIPGLMAAILMLLRTSFEDRMLNVDLPGYAEYAREVRYRLFPGIW